MLSKYYHYILLEKRVKNMNTHPIQRGLKILVVSCVLSSVCTPVFAQRQDTRSPEELAKATEDGLKRQYGWATEAWSENTDKKYQAVRRSIDLQLRQGVPAAQLAQRFQPTRSQFNNPLIQFRWGYAAYEAMRASNFQDAAQIQSRLQWAAFTAPTPPRSAEFARLLFLAHCRIGTYAPIKTLGERLVREFPDDFEVKWLAFHDLKPGRTIEHRRLALTWAKQLKKQQPKKPGINLLIPSIYDKVWAVEQTRPAANKAIAEYRTYLRITPRNDPQRAWAEKEIRFIQKFQPFLERKKRERAKQGR